MKAHLSIFKTWDFIKLRDQWYDRLKDEGFEDIEDWFHSHSTEDFPDLLPETSTQKKVILTDQEYLDSLSDNIKETALYDRWDYYTEIGYFLENKHERKRNNISLSRTDRDILKMELDGLTHSDMVASRKRRKKNPKLARRTISEHLKKLRKQVAQVRLARLQCEDRRRKQ